MKLIARATSYFFVIYVIVMIFCAVFLFFSIRSLIYKQIDDSLITEKNIIQEQIQLTDSIPDFAASSRHQIEVKLLERTVRYSEKFRDTSVYNSESGDREKFRCLTCTGDTEKGHGFIIRILQPLDENEELLQDIGLYMFFLFLGILIASILINYLVSRKLWNPFYLTVKLASNFNVQTDRPLNLPDSETDEFRQLNKVISQMTERIKRDYLNLKEFNEDASHEIQTPLAIIRSKMELIMQNRNLRKEDLEHIKTINDATNRLLRLNQGLLLITKIDNNYFQNDREVSLRQVIENYLDNYREIMQMKSITTEFVGSGRAIVKMDDILADILVSNLISNAVRYNVDNGFIKFNITDELISISNSGIPPETDPELLFKRFRKGTRSLQSVGLGLSIVRKITEKYNMIISYTYSDNVHKITLFINPGDKA